MYILSRAWPSPGIEPRMPTVLGWSRGLQTSIVAHSSREVSSVSLWARACARPPARPRRSAARRRPGRESGARAARRGRAFAATQASRLTIAPPSARGAARAGASGAAAPRRVVFPARWGQRAQRTSSSCSGACPSSRRSSAATSSGSPRSRCRASSSPGRSCSARATPATPATSSATATRARSARTATGARSRSRRSAPATSSASSRCSRTSAARRPSKAIETTSVVGVLGPDMRRLMSEHPEIATRLVIALGRRLRETNERLSRQSFQTVQSRVAVVLSELVAQEIAAGHAAARRARHRHPGRSRPAGRLLARVGQPLPGRARARRRDLPGPRAPRRPRPGGAEAVCLLAAAPSQRAQAREFSAGRRRRARGRRSS